MNASDQPAPQDVSLDVLREKYAKGNEAGIDDVRRRVARALAALEPAAQRAALEQRFLWAQDQGFVPAGRINAAAGLGLQSTLINCFVQPVGDSISGSQDGLPAGGPIARALADMRDVVWEKGPVRCGYLTREDGAQVPVYHDSEVAAIAFMLQRVLIRRGFLDAWGNQMPLAELARRHARADGRRWRPPPPPPTVAGAQPAAGGATCPECGARALHKVDGCTRCNECHYVGECG